MRRSIAITGLAHDAAEGAAGIALCSLALGWGWPWWVAVLLASPIPPLVKLINHRLAARGQGMQFEASWEYHLKDGAWEMLVWGTGWWVALGSWYLTVPAVLAWWPILAWFRRYTKWGWP